MFSKWFINKIKESFLFFIKYKIYKINRSENRKGIFFQIKIINILQACRRRHRLLLPLRYFPPAAWPYWHKSRQTERSRPCPRRRRSTRTRTTWCRSTPRNQVGKELPQVQPRKVVVEK